MFASLNLESTKSLSFVEGSTFDKCLQINLNREHFVRTGWEGE